MSWLNQPIVRSVLGRLIVVDFQEVTPAPRDLLNEAFQGLGQTKVTEDGNKAVSAVAGQVPTKKLGARGKWGALVQSNKLHKLHRMPQASEVDEQELLASASKQVLPIPQTVRKLQLKRASTPVLATYSNHRDPNWPAFIGASLTKFLGG